MAHSRLQMVLNGVKVRTRLVETSLIPVEFALTTSFIVAK